MQKKNQQNRNKKDLLGKANYNEQAVTLVKIAVGVIIVLGVVYLLTALKTGEIKLGSTKKDEVQEATIQYEEIIAGQILNRKPEEYYVLSFEFTDTEASYYLSLKDNYSKNTDAIPFYIVDLEKGYNKSILKEEGQEVKELAENIKELKVTSPTLLKVKAGKVIERVETAEKVKEYLEKIS